MNPFFKIVLMIFFSLSSYLLYHEIYIDTSNLLLQTKKNILIYIYKNVRISLLNLYIKDIPSKQHTRTIHISSTQPSLVKASTD